MIASLLTVGLLVAFFYLALRGISRWRGGVWKKLTWQAKLLSCAVPVVLLAATYYLYLPAWAIWLGLIMGAGWFYRDRAERCLRQLPGVARLVRRKPSGTHSRDV